jgi:DNA ligase-1
VEDVVIMSGLPSSGKTTWAANNLHGFHRIASEQYKTQPKMVSAAETAYKEGARKFVFDATNATAEHRKVYIDWANKHGLSSKCVFVNTEVKEAIRRNELKADPTPKIAIYVTLKKLTVPKESEGCTVQIISDGPMDPVDAKKSPPKPKAGAPQPEKSAPGALQPGFGVMLAKNFEPGIDPSGWWFSEKLDGMRAIWTGSKLISRNGNEIAIPDWFRSWMPTHPLDGELFTKRGDFQHIVSIVRKIVPVDSEWKQIKYMIFDLPAEKSPFEARYEKLHEVVAATCGSDGACPLQVVSQTRIADFEDLQRMHKALVAKGAEGSMLRKPGSAYENKRSSSLLKLKDFDEADAVVTGAELGTGKYQNVMGYLSAKLRDEPAITFDLGSGFTDAQRRDYKKLFPVGTIIRVTFNGRTNAGKPRFPVFDGIHIDR